MVQNNKNMMVIALLTIFAKLIAIIRQIVLTYFFGASAISDAYILSQTIPNTLFLLVSSAIGVSFTPIFNQIKREQSDKEAEKYTTRMVNMVLILASLITLLTLLFSSQIVFLFASGFDATTAELAVRYLRISVFSIYFIGMCGVFSAYLKIKGDFFTPSIIGLVLSIVEIISCILAYYYNDILLAVGITIAALVQFGVVFCAALKSGYRRYRKLSIFDPYIKRTIMRSLPVIIGLGVDEINVIVDKTIASEFQTGSISVLNYSNTLVSVVHNVISVSINTVLFTEVSRLAVEDDRKQIAKHIRDALSTALLFLIPGMVGIIIYAEPIIKILYERGNFSHSSTVVTAGTMAFYALSIVPNGIRIISESYFYAYGKTKFCMYVGFITIAVNLVCNLCLSRFIGINGLALATSISVGVGAVVLLLRLVYDNKEIKLSCFLKKSFVMVINALIMGGLSYLTFSFLERRVSLILALIIAVIIALASYFLLSIVTKTLDRNAVRRAIKR